MAEFEVYLSKADFKFNCAHFIAYDGFRERLHGHNYKIGVRLIGGETIGDDGYLMDFGDVKKIVRKLCKSMNEYFICPMKSTCIKISEEGPQMCMECQDGASFSFPKEDCLLLPLSHSSAEELAHFMYCSIVREAGLDTLLSRGLKTMCVDVAEADAQSAIYRRPLPTSQAAFEELEKASVFGKPKPCLANDDA